MKAVWPTEPIDGRGNDRALRPLMPDVDYMSRAEAIRERDEALLRVQANSVPWRTVAYDVLRELAQRERLVHSELLWAVLAERGIPRPTEPRAMGAVFVRAIRENWLEPGPYVNSTDPKSHRDPMRTYRSLLTGDK